MIGCYRRCLTYWIIKNLCVSRIQNHRFKTKIEKLSTILWSCRFSHEKKGVNMKRLLATVAGVCLMGLMGTMLAAPSLYVGKLNLNDKSLVLFPPDNTYKHLPGHHVYIGKGFGGRHHHFVIYNIKKANCSPGYLNLWLQRTGKQPPKSAGSYLHNDEHEAMTVSVPLGNIKKWGRVVYVCPRVDYQYLEK